MWICVYDVDDGGGRRYGKLRIFAYNRTETAMKWFQSNVWRERERKRKRRKKEKCSILKLCTVKEPATKIQKLFHKIHAWTKAHIDGLMSKTELKKQACAWTIEICERAKFKEKLRKKKKKFIFTELQLPANRHTINENIYIHFQWTISTETILYILLRLNFISSQVDRS